MAQAGKGRPKGVPNKATTAIKEMVIAALDKAGGVDYLVTQASSNPTAFLGLVGKVLPLQLTGVDGGPIEHLIREDAEAVAALISQLANRSEAGITLQ